jgi:16S rRNA (guanine(966)-N(2))-methyltransferase RsmD
MIKTSGMRTHLRIVAGTLRGRKLSYDINPALRPAPQMVREALFSILGAGIRGRPFYDLFAGTGAVGLEALSRGAEPVVFVERDARTASQIERYLRDFGMADRAHVQKSDAYRWARHWEPGEEAVNLFLGPPFSDLGQRADDLLQMLALFQQKLPRDSVMALQAEEAAILAELPDPGAWERRQYGRNLLFFWVKEEPAAA